MTRSIQATTKDRLARDVLRVKGGVSDYCVIDVRALHEFQNSHRSPAKLFTPVSDGFSIDFSCEIFLVREEE